MKKLLLVSFLASFLSVGYLQAQSKSTIETFTIQNNSDKSKSSFYKTSIEKADLETYRLRDKNVILKFSEGFECVLLSAFTLKNMGASIDVDTYKTDFSEEFKMPQFSIHESGIVKVAYTKTITK
jgi:hypothetical protein